MEVYTYCYLFESGGKRYYIYKESRALAIADYLTTHDLLELPKDCVISRILD